LGNDSVLALSTTAKWCTCSLVQLSPAGNVGIGTSAPEALLDLYSASGVQLRLANATTGTDATDGTRIYLSGSDLFIVNRENAPIKFFTSDTERFAITNNGVTFNGDTAAANALDDYEEGTFDFGIAFGGASVGYLFASRQEHTQRLDVKLRLMDLFN
jgi:hypothetical protein